MHNIQLKELVMIFEEGPLYGRIGRFERNSNYKYFVTYDHHPKWIGTISEALCVKCHPVHFPIEIKIKNNIYQIFSRLRPQINLHIAKFL